MDWITPFRQPTGGRMGLLQISCAARRISPVFIIGEARSGSSMLYRTLLRHPAFAPRAETLQESSFIRQAPLAYRFDAGHPSNMRRYMLSDDDAWRAFLDSLRPVRPLLATAALSQPLLAERFDWAWRLVPSRLVARSYLWHAQRARACRRILEKTPRHVEHIGKLLGCFPRARLLYIHRHPVDVYSSLSVAGPPVNGESGSWVLLLCCWLDVADRSRGSRWSARSNARTNDLDAGEGVAGSWSEAAACVTP
jgi:Sulfotransferase family